MKKCSSCGHENAANDIRCPECGGFYSKVLEMIEEIAAEEEQNSLRGRYHRIMSSGDSKQAILSEWRQFKSGISKQGWFTIYVIFAFIFWLIAIVL